MLTSIQLRSLYRSFFEERCHVAIPSASLVPANDPTVLFTTAGMHPLVPYLLGEPHPAGNRLVNVQKCVRTGDIDVVGDDTHLTFFEMLGNWSLGDYYREDSIRWSHEFLTGARWLGLPVERLGVTCFAGDEEVPVDRTSAPLRGAARPTGGVARDDASVRIWQSLGIARERIQLLGRDDNWWGPAGRTGPCGPDTEIFTWVGDEPPPRVLDVADRRWVEIWNNVFMGYAKTASGTIVPLDRVNVDTGMGLERTLVALGGLRSVYEIDTVKPLYDELRAMAARDGERELRIATDHLRAACFLIADGVGPSNKDRGYVLRRLLRRAILFAQRLGMPGDWYRRGVACLARTLGDAYPELAGDLAPVIADEARRFERTLAAGLREIGKRRVLDGQAAFDLFQTHGFPLELTRELAQSTGTPIDEEGVREALERHRAQSKLAGTGSFAGGLADHSEEIVRYHTVTHLLQAALREVLGTHVIQRGSNLTRERLRFDFSHEGKPSPDELARVEARVNEWLGRELVVERASMTEREARATGAIGAFGEKYGEIVAVHTIRDRATGEVVSREFCGGPHVSSTAELRGRFHIEREQAVSAGIRRIRAVLV